MRGQARREAGQGEQQAVHLAGASEMQPDTMPHRSGILYAEFCCVKVFFLSDKPKRIDQSRSISKTREQNAQSTRIKHLLYTPLTQHTQSSDYHSSTHESTLYKKTNCIQ